MPSWTSWDSIELSRRSMWNWAKISWKYRQLQSTNVRAVIVFSLLFWSTAVCTPAGNDLSCSCEKGYVWPREKCLHNLTCQEHGSALSGRSCSCLKGLPPQGPFCQLSDGMELFSKYLLGGYSTLPQANVSLYCLYLKTNETVTFCPVFFSIYYLQNQSQTEHRISRRPQEFVLCPL